MKDIGYK